MIWVNHGVGNLFVSRASWKYREHRTIYLAWIYS